MIGFLIAAIVVLLVVWMLPELQRQKRVMTTIALGLLTVVYFCFWLLVLSRLEWGVRVVGFGFVVALGVLAGGVLKFDSFNGDMMPQFSWRWEGDAAVVQSEPMNEGFLIEDYPQFLGPDRNGILGGPVLDTRWDVDPPKQLWRRPIGQGWSGFAVHGTNAVTLEQREGLEVVACYDVLSGNPIWEHTYSARYDNPVGGVGPRSVPTIADGRVYSMGSSGDLTCIQIDGGRLLWQTNVVQANEAALPEWGVTSAPLLLDDRVIVSAGGPDERSLVAYDANSGELMWGGGTDPSSFSAPASVTLDGVEQVVIFNQPNVAGHDPDTGELLWRYPWGGGQPHVAVPKQVGEDRLFVSSGYGVGAELLKVSRDTTDDWQVERLWKSIRMKAKFNNVVELNGFIYGLDDGILACLDLADGSQRWKDGRYGHGQMIAVGELMIITGERGEVILFEPSPEAPRELSRFTAFDHKQWNPPALAGQLLLVRTDREAACYVLPIVSESADSGIGAPDPE